MIAPAIPADEEKRLISLHQLLILDTPPEERFDMLTAYATLQFTVPIALVSLIDADRSWSKSRCGLPGAKDTARDFTFCGHAILSDDVLIVADALKDERFFDNPFVIGEPFIRFYAGAPIILADGMRMGTLCLIDRRPRRLEPHEIGHLRSLALVVALELQGIDAAGAFLRQAG